MPASSAQTWPIATDVACSMVCVSVCLPVCILGTLVNCAKTAKLIKMPFGGRHMWVMERIRWGPDPTREWLVLRGTCASPL